MRKKNRFEKVKKYGVLTLLILITLGFLIPGFIQPQEEPVNPSDVKVCSSDNDCYLTCDNKLTSVLCFRNICEIDSCESAPQYEFSEVPEDISIAITLEGEELNLNDRFTQFGVGTFFVNFRQDGAELYTTRVPLGYILENVGIRIQNSCLIIDAQSYCEDELTQNTLRTKVNGQERFLSEDLLISRGDALTIDFE